MTDDVQQPNEPKPAFLQFAAPLADTLSKSVAAAAIALYVFGFLIISLYHAKFGFVGTNPFRSRVLAAGAWFSFFMAIPASIAWKYRFVSWLKIARNLFLLWFLFYYGSMAFAETLFDLSDHRSLGAILAPPLVGAVLVSLLPIQKERPHWIFAMLSVSATLFFASYPIRAVAKHDFDSSVVALWFFVTCLILKVEFEAWFRKHPAWPKYPEGSTPQFPRWISPLFAWPKYPEEWITTPQFPRWITPLIVLFVLLAVFSRGIYPRLKESWGGGTPANVTVYFSKDSLLNPNKTVQAQLIEESDEGFYIVGPKESKAIFVPRASVAMIYFSDKPADSPLLQNKP